MQSCASAAKLRSGGPILPIGMKAKGLVGNPPPRTIIGTPSQAYEQGRNCRGARASMQITGRPSRLSSVHSHVVVGPVSMPIRTALPDMQASAYGVKADLIICHIMPTSDSFQLRELTAQEASSDPCKNEQFVRSAAVQS